MECLFCSLEYIPASLFARHFAPYFWYEESPWIGLFEQCEEDNETIPTMPLSESENVEQKGFTKYAYSKIANTTITNINNI